ncbi:MAG: aldo/keto reductase, partial [Clostridia bacterium]|nr:aldo/keto reductase [Clostridia bacterium]
MIYRPFQNLRLSALGFGAMRLPVIDGDDGRIDEETAFRMVDAAMAGGINYYDTAWGYHDGMSELVMGKALSRYPRDRYYLATKFPGYDPANWSRVEEIFEAQLKKLNTDHFDFYLFHNVCEMNVDAYLDDAKYGIYSYLTEQKRNGRIRHLGFSCHGGTDVLERFLDAYGKDMEFCQLQINYVDWTFQNGREKTDLLNRL